MTNSIVESTTYTKDFLTRSTFFNGVNDDLK
jgi:hypothetical protein